MLKKQIKIGATYSAKVSNKICAVRIDSESRYGGWNATNLDTGRVIRIKSAAKLRNELYGAYPFTPKIADPIDPHGHEIDSTPDEPFYV